MATTNANINVSVTGQQQIDSLKKSLTGIQGQLQTFGNLVKGIALSNLIGSIGKLNQSLIQASKASEVSLDSVAAFAKSVKNAGGDAERAAGDVIDFVAGLTAAKQGSADAQAELAAVGISLRDLATLSNEALFQKTIDGLMQIQDSSLRNQLAVRLLGKSFKDLDIVTVGNGFKSLSGTMNTGAIQASADAQKNLSKQFGKLTSAINEAIEPLNRVVASIDIGADTMKSLVNIVLGVASAWLILGKALPFVYTQTDKIFKFFVALKTAGTGLATLVGGALTAAWANFGQIFTNIGRALAGGGAGGIFGSLVVAAGAFLKVLLRFAGWIGIAYTILEVLDLIVKKLFDFSILDWVTEKFSALWAVVKNLLGFKDNTVAKETEKAGEKAKEYASIVKDANQKVRDEMAKTVTAYQQVNAQQLRQIENEIELIGKGEEFKSLKEATYQAETKYLDEVNGMLEKYRELQSAAENTPAFSKERAQFEAYRESMTKGMQDITDAYLKQIPAVKALAQAKADAQELDRVRLFGIQQEQDAFDKLQEIQDEIAKSTMTELEQKYYDIERAADKAALAGIRAAEAALGRPLTDNEAAKYYEAARKSAEDLKNAQGRLYEQSRSFSTGWKRAFNDYIDNATNAAKKAEQIFTKAMSGMEDLIVNFAKTGKFEWKNFVNMMAEELLRAQIQQIFAQMFGGMQNTMQTGMRGGAGYGGAPIGNMGGSVLGGLGNVLGGLFGGGRQQPVISGGGIGGGIFGGSGGGIMGGIGNVIGGIAGGIGSVVKGIGSTIGDLFGGWFANGGTLGAGQWGIAGERGPELISGPANITPMGGTNVTYNISAVDAQSFQALVARDPQFIHAVAMAGARGIPQGRR